MDTNFAPYHDIDRTLCPSFVVSDIIAQLEELAERRQMLARCVYDLTTDQFHEDIQTTLDLKSIRELISLLKTIDEQNAYHAGCRPNSAFTLFLKVAA